MSRLLLFALFFAVAPVLRAQLLWEHKTNYQWINPETQESDSDITFTAIASNGKCITAAAVSSFPAARPYRITFYRSNDDGLTWFEQSPSVPFHLSLTNKGITKLQQIDSLHVVGTGELGTVYMTSDAGVSWYRRDLPAKRDVRDVHFSDANTGIIVSAAIVENRDSIVFTTTDGGTTWIKQNFDSIFFTSCYSYGNGKFKVYGDSKGPIFSTKDNFVTVDTQLIIPATSVYENNRFVFSRCEFRGGDTLFGYGVYWATDTNTPYSSYSAIVRSLDDGKTWEKPWVFRTDTLASITHISSPQRDTIYAGGAFLSHYLISTDRGLTWRADTVVFDIPFDQINSCIGMLLSESGHPVAIFGVYPLVTYSCVWRGKYTTTKTPIAYTLSYNTQLYPNPSSGKFSVTLKVLKSAPLTITDMLGRVVEIGKLSEDGIAEFDLSNKPRGIYYITVNFAGREYMVGKIALTLE